MKKFVKIFTLSTIFVILLGVFTAGIYLTSSFVKYSTLPLDTNSLSASSLKIPIYDKDNRIINEDNSFESQYVKLSQMPPYAYQSFISIEDKDFYKHNGVNLKRIAVATVNNIKNMSFSQGASTISQQLIKNTHLSSDKTIERKIKEVVLTKKLEKQLSKEEILESYLNVIYFGNNCYGIASACDYYFSKPCKDLTLEESALLAGMIKSPNKYSPITNENTALSRRNLVLKEMLKDKKINQAEYLTAKSKKIELNLNTINDNKLNSYSESALDEAKSILHLPTKQIALGKYKIHTYQDKEIQNNLNDSLNSVSFDSCDYAGMITDNKTHGITGYVGKSAYKILDAKRQPGSCIKPLLVYAPAINEDIISPYTQILDEKLKIAEYSPENVNGKFNGYISVKDALSRSINIPAVKVLSYIGLDKAKSYASSMGIKFDEKDDSYALALGGMTYGVNLQQLCSAYSTFANNGNFAESKFISYITNADDKIIYIHKPEEKQVLRKDTAYLITDILKETAKTGTAKKLSSLNINIASKTGTVGKANSKQNLDAWNISYTPSQTCGIWAGNLDNTPMNLAGGNQPTEVIKNIFKNTKQEEFEKPNEIVYRDIDLIDLEENHKLSLANQNTPERFKKTCIFSIFNIPSESKNFAEMPEVDCKTKVIEDKNYLIINTKKYLIYEIYNDKNKLIEEIKDKEGELEFPISVEKITIKTRYIDSKNKTEKTIKFKLENSFNEKEKNEDKNKHWWEI